MRTVLIFTSIVFIVCVYGGVRLFWNPAAHTPNISAAPPTVSTDIATVNQERKQTRFLKRNNTQHTDPEAFYQTIIKRCTIQIMTNTKYFIMGALFSNII